MSEHTVYNLYAFWCEKCNMEWFGDAGVMAYIPEEGEFSHGLAVVTGCEFIYLCPKCKSRGHQTIAFNENDVSVKVGVHFMPGTLILCISPSPEGFEKRKHK